MSVLMSVSRAVCWIIDEYGDGEGRKEGRRKMGWLSRALYICRIFD